MRLADERIAKLVNTLICSISVMSILTLFPLLPSREVIVLVALLSSLGYFSPGLALAAAYFYSIVAFSYNFPGMALYYLAAISLLVYPSYLFFPASGLGIISLRLLLSPLAFISPGVVASLSQRKGWRSGMAVGFLVGLCGAAAVLLFPYDSPLFLRPVDMTPIRLSFKGPLRALTAEDLVGIFQQALSLYVPGIHKPLGVREGGFLIMGIVTWSLIGLVPGLLRESIGEKCIGNISITAATASLIIPLALGFARSDATLLSAGFSGLLSVAFFSADRLFGEYPTEREIHLPYYRGKREVRPEELSADLIFSDIVGYREQLNRLIDAVKSSIASGDSKAILLFGPAGVGKSKILNDLASRSGLSSLVLDEGSVKVGLATLMSEIEYFLKDRRNLLILIDEVEDLIESIARNSGIFAKRVAGRLLAQILRVKYSGRGRIVILSSSKPELLRYNMAGILDDVVYLPPPPPSLRRTMCKSFLQTIALDEKTLDVLARLTENYVPTELRRVAESLKRKIVLKYREVPTPVSLSEGEIRSLLEDLSPELTPGAVAKFERTYKVYKKVILASDPRLLSDLEKPFRRLEDAFRISLIEPSIARSHGVAPPKILLMVGPEGCGKTFMARILSRKFGLRLVVVDFDVLMDLEYKHIPAVLKKMLEYAMERPKSVVLVKKIENLVPLQSRLPTYMIFPILNMLLDYLERAREGELEILTIITSTSFEFFKALALRKEVFDEIIRVDYPTEATRLELMERYLDSLGVEVADADLGLLSKAMPGYSCRELALSLIEAWERALERDPHDPKVTMQDLIEALALRLI